tara:strand:+ start:39 stop:407 length:369 start_codon:yes stop_codon:yes gene_type:complete
MANRIKKIKGSPRDTQRKTQVKKGFQGEVKEFKEKSKNRKKVDVNRNQERSKPNIIIEAGVAEGPAKQNTTIKTFKFPLQKEVLVNKDNMIKTVPAKIGQFDKGGKVKLALRGGGRAYNKNS